MKEYFKRRKTYDEEKKRYILFGSFWPEKLYKIFTNTVVMSL